MDNVRVTSVHPDARPLMICADVRGLRINGLQSDPSVTAEHLLALDNVCDAVIRGVIPPPGTRTWVRASGRATENVLLLPDDLRNVETPLELDRDVPSDAVRVRVP
jgi:hypothetical protein